MIRMHDPDQVQQNDDPRKVEGCWAIKDVMAAVLDRYQLGPAEVHEVSPPLPMVLQSGQPDLALALAGN